MTNGRMTSALRIGLNLKISNTGMLWIKQKRLTLADSYFDEGEFNLGLAHFYQKQDNKMEEKKYMKIATRCFRYAKRLRGRDRA